MSGLPLFTVPLLDAGVESSDFTFHLIIYILSAIGLYKVFQKADEPAWAAFVPGYNLYIVTKIGRQHPRVF